MFTCLHVRIYSHFSLKHVSSAVIAPSCCKVRDHALDCGVYGTIFMQSLFRIMTRPVCSHYFPDLDVNYIVHAIEDLGPDLMPLLKLSDVFEVFLYILSPCVVVRMTIKFLLYLHLSLLGNDINIVIIIYYYYCCCCCFCYQRWHNKYVAMILKQTLLVRLPRL